MLMTVGAGVGIRVDDHGIASIAASGQPGVLVGRLDSRNSPGRHLVYQYRFGGGLYDPPTVLDVGAQGTIFVTGQAKSATFQTTLNAYWTPHLGLFVCRFHARVRCPGRWEPS